MLNKILVIAEYFSEVYNVPAGELKVVTDFILSFEGSAAVAKVKLINM